MNRKILKKYMTLADLSGFMDISSKHCGLHSGNGTVDSQVEIVRGLLGIMNDKKQMLVHVKISFVRGLLGNYLDI